MTQLSFPVPEEPDVFTKKYVVRKCYQNGIHLDSFPVSYEQAAEFIGLGRNFWIVELGRYSAL